MITVATSISHYQHSFLDDLILHSARWSSQIVFRRVDATCHTSVIINYLSTLFNSSTLYSRNVSLEIIVRACRGRGPFAQVKSPDGSPGATWDDRPVALIEIAETVNPSRPREGYIIGFDVNRKRATRLRSSQ